MKDLIEKNRKYVIIILFGILLLLFSSGLSGGDAVSSGSDEKRFEKLISGLRDVKEPQVMVTYGKEKEVLGVIIITKNKLNTKTAAEITNAAQAAFGAGAHKIVILP